MYKETYGIKYPANRKRYHNVCVWLYKGLVATQLYRDVTMTFSIRCVEVRLRPTIRETLCKRSGENLLGSLTYTIAFSGSHGFPVHASL